MIPSEQSQRPVLIFDGDCGFCRRWIAYWQTLTQGEVDCLPYQEVGSRYSSIPHSDFENAVQFVEPDGRVYRAAHAVFKTLAIRKGFRWMLRAYEKVPGVASATEFLYRLVARNRTFFSRITYALWGEDVRPSTFFLTRWLYLRGLGATYLAAFVSFWVQARGLVGSQGVLPTELDDGVIQAICVAGTALSVLLTIGFAPLLCTALLWLLYWKVADISGPFLWFQWDSLMLEMGLVGVFLSPGAFLPKSLSKLWTERPPSNIALWVLRWLVFRVLFGSGIVKLQSGDPTWRNLTALKYHFETQPLPTWMGWWLHQFSLWGLQAICALTFVVELVFPFLIFLPRRARIVAFFAFLGLQLAIDTGGNYGFFGLQTVVISIVLLDDAFLSKWLPAGVRPKALSGAAFTGTVSERSSGLRIAKTAVTAVFAMAVLLVTVFQNETVQERLNPLRSINSYGVFAIMTTLRPEIIIEGSDDGKVWRPYEFRWKPGDPARRPAFLSPHMPRLDWQMWFAALGSREGNPWFENLMIRLLEGSQPVTALFEKNPFPDHPPKLLRAQLYEYRFTDFTTRRITNDWWSREYRKPYFPVVSLKPVLGP